MTTPDKALRIDLIIAICALVMSTLATGASWWQSRVVATQLSSQVWPYLSIGTTLSPDSVELDISNDGLGPAVVRSVVLTVDGKPYPDVGEAVRALVGPSAPPAQGTTASLETGSVVRSGASVTLFKLRNRAFVRAVATRIDRVDVRVCYCSILGDCWTRGVREPEPQRTGTCPYDRATNYRGIAHV